MKKTPLSSLGSNSFLDIVNKKPFAIKIKNKKAITDFFLSIIKFNVSK